MTDFNRTRLFKLSKIDTSNVSAQISPFLVDGETIISSYKAPDDFIVFTNKRIISEDFKNNSRHQKDLTSMPYSRISVFSVEEAEDSTKDNELEMYFSGVGKVTFEFTDNSDIAKIGKEISGFCLK